LWVGWGVKLYSSSSVLMCGQNAEKCLAKEAVACLALIVHTQSVQQLTPK